MSAEADRWNHNIQYHPLLVAAVPPGAQHALDVGCGEGMLARRLAHVVPHVVGIDADRASVDAAVATSPASLEFVHGDVLTHPFPAESFDVFVSVATLHHMDAPRGLERMAGLLRPGGRLALVGLARASRPSDLPWELGGAVAHRILRRRHTFWDHPSPIVWPPPATYSQLRRVAATVLPGSVFRRRLLWRYSLTWTKPRD